MLLEYCFDILLYKNEQPPQFTHQICVSICVVYFEPSIWTRQKLFSYVCCDLINNFFLYKMVEVACHEHVVGCEPLNCYNFLFQIEDIEFIYLKGSLFAGSHEIHYFFFKKEVLSL